VEAVLDRTGYRRMLEAEQDEDDDGHDRLANVEELLGAARQFDDDVAVGPADGAAADALGGFLETTALVADTDAWDASGDRVALMTLHAAKGLEFPVVYLMALEDGIVPHERSLDREDQLEEERRLVFVGITRGREEVCASCARLRDYRGMRRIAAPSLFLAEMAGSETDVTGPEAPPAGGTGLGDAFRVDAEGLDAASQEEHSRGSGTRSEARDDGLVLEVEDAEPAPRTERPRPRPAPALERAADLAARLAGGASRPSFEQGQRVRHADYGDGVLAAISGTGPRSVGTVIFDGPAGTRKFILGHGALQPVS
jgi:DNA helicase-2/ATP-dependent DNA helicase PcrA